MAKRWPTLRYEEWRETRDTLHAHTQILGKLAVAMAPAEPQLQHTALRLTARGWETRPLPTPDRAGVIVAGLDLIQHTAFVEHSDGRRKQIPLIPHRPVAEITREIMAAITEWVGEVTISLMPQEVDWTVPLDRDYEHRTYDRAQVEQYFECATSAALVLADCRAPYRGRSTSVNAWWGAFDLAVSLYSGEPADPPAADFLSRNALDAQEVAVGWWPGDANYPEAAFYAYAHPAPAHYSQAALSPAAARWEPKLGEFILDWEDVRQASDPHAAALEFARSALIHSCRVCEWDPQLPASIEGEPPPLV